MNKFSKEKQVARLYVLAHFNRRMSEQRNAVVAMTVDDLIGSDITEELSVYQANELAERVVDDFIKHILTTGRVCGGPGVEVQFGGCDQPVSIPVDAFLEAFMNRSPLVLG